MAHVPATVLDEHRAGPGAAGAQRLQKLLLPSDQLGVVQRGRAPASAFAALNVVGDLGPV
ncbi:hypothetical protein [Kitasatospora sp. NPDC058046]|uniref:hypothetical protein n=1 Tax=Kitasatospora sp. NPDC058046 TaxID=3346312 RepID=UPI0036D7688C